FSLYYLPCRHYCFFFFLLIPPPPISTLFPYTTLFRSPAACLDAERLLPGRILRSSHEKAGRGSGFLAKAGRQAVILGRGPRRGYGLFRGIFETSGYAARSPERVSQARDQRDLGSREGSTCFRPGSNAARTGRIGGNSSRRRCRRRLAAL